MSGETILIEQLRAEVERLRERAEKAERFIATADSEWKARAEKAERERDVLRHHYEEAIPEHNLFALLDMYDGRRAAAESERDDLRADLDRRPEITPEDARIFVDWWDSDLPSTDSAVRTVNTLRAHAAKAVKP